MLSPFLTPIWMDKDAVLTQIEEPTDYVWFPEAGIVSVVALGEHEKTYYAGIYGSEGAGSMAAILGAPTAPHLEIVQFPGAAQRISSRDLSHVIHKCPELRSKLLRYAHVYFMQLSYGAFSNSSTRMEQRVARWLLMIQDRLQIASLPITHHYLAMLLGVRRPGVTDAIHRLEGQKVIRSQRGVIDILDRHKLASLTAGSYGKPEAEYKRVV